MWITLGICALKDTKTLSFMAFSGGNRIKVSYVTFHVNHAKP